MALGLCSVALKFDLALSSRMLCTCIGETQCSHLGISISSMDRGVQINAFREYTPELEVLVQIFLLN